MGLQIKVKTGISRKKDLYQPPEANLLSKIKDVGFRIQGYHLLYNEEDPGTNHLIADVDLGSSKPSQVEAVFPSSEKEYDEEFFAAFEEVLGRISSSFGNLLQTNSDIEGFSLNIKGMPVNLRLLDNIRKS